MKGFQDNMKILKTGLDNTTKENQDNIEKCTFAGAMCTKMFPDNVMDMRKLVKAYKQAE